MIGVVLPAGGVGARMGGDKPKQFLEIQGRPIYRHALDVFLEHPLISEIVFVCGADWLAHFSDEFKDLPIKVVVGGKERWNSVYNGLQALSDDVKSVMVHDVARPFLPQSLLESCISELQADRSFVVALKAVDTIKRSRTASQVNKSLNSNVITSSIVDETLNRDEIWLAQTPQGSSKQLLIDCFDSMSQTDQNPTDEASVLEACGIDVHLIEGSSWNDKLTTPEDLSKFQSWLQVANHNKN